MDTPPSAAAATATAVASDSDCDSALVADVAEALVSASRLPEPPPIPALLALYLPRLAASHHPRVLSLAASHPGLASPDLLLAYRRHLSPPSCLPSLVPLLPVLPYRHLLPLLLSFVPLDPLRHLHRHLLAHLPTMMILDSAAEVAAMIGSTAEAKRHPLCRPGRYTAPISAG
uniref:Uncharacterized protein n=1 Tax=Oryza rufipogon TaxID=4529 RepID=A0A0E0NR37_ORYRU